MNVPNNHAIIIRDIEHCEAEGNKEGENKLSDKSTNTTSSAAEKDET